MMLKPQDKDSLTIVARGGDNSATNVERTQIYWSGKPGQMKFQNRDHKDTLYLL